MSFHHIFINDDKKNKSNKISPIDSLYQQTNSNIRKSNNYSKNNKNNPSNNILKEQLKHIKLFPPINQQQTNLIDDNQPKILISTQRQHIFSSNKKSKKQANHKTLFKMSTQHIIKSNGPVIQSSNISDKTKQKTTVNKSIISQIEQQNESKISNDKFMRTFMIRKSYQQTQLSKIIHTNTKHKTFDPTNISNMTLANFNSQPKNSQRIIKQYSVNRLLGKGGFAEVYEVTHIHTQIKYAMKEYNLTASWQCYKNQAKIGEYFFTNSNKQIHSQDCENIVKFIQKFKINKKGYIIQQICGVNFSKLISEIKGTFYNKQRVYEVTFNQFYSKMKNKSFFNSVILQICQGIKSLNSNGFVHCDLKLQNILIDYNQNNNQNHQQHIIPVLKIIDFGSTFQYRNGLPKITITPEYMPPQLLAQFQKNKQSPILQSYDKIDIWSIGCILLQIFTGVPLWFKYKCKVDCYDKTFLHLSIFALTNRDYTKIIKKQKQLCESYINSIPFTCREFECYRKILKKIFVFDPQKRINIDNLMKEFSIL